MPNSRDAIHRSTPTQPLSNDDRRDHFYANPVPAWLVDRLGNVIASNAAARRVVAPAHTGLSLALILHSEADCDLLVSQLQCCALGLSLLQMPVTVLGACGAQLSGDFSFSAPGDGLGPPWWQVQFIDRSAEIDSRRVLQSLLENLTTSDRSNAAYHCNTAMLQSVLMQAVAMAGPWLARLSVRIDCVPSPAMQLACCASATPQLVRDLVLHVGKRCAPQGCIRLRAEPAPGGVLIRVGVVPQHANRVLTRDTKVACLALAEVLRAEQQQATELGGRLAICSAADMVDGVSLLLPAHAATP